MLRIRFPNFRMLRCSALVAIAVLIPFGAAPVFAQAVADAQPASAHETESGGLPLTPLLLLGAVLFVLFFLVGFYSFTFGH